MDKGRLKRGALIIEAGTQDKQSLKAAEPFSFGRLRRERRHEIRHHMAALFFPDCSQDSFT